MLPISSYFPHMHLRLFFSRNCTPQEMPLHIQTPWTLGETYDLLKCFFVGALGTIHIRPQAWHSEIYTPFGDGGPEQSEA